MAWMDTYAAYIGSYTQAYVPEAQIDAMRGSHALGIFFRMATDPALHIWFGFNDIPAGFDSIDEDGTVYLGGGEIADIPTLEILINNQADDVEFGIRGIDPATAQRVSAQLPPVRGKDINLGITPLDKYYQPVGPIVPLWLGTASHTTEAMPPVTGLDQRTVTLSLAAVSGNNTRSRPSLVTWTPAQHKSLYPTDLFCDGVARLARGVAPAWPTY